jgi:hypothetical protein
MASTLEPDVQPSHPLSRKSDDPAGDWMRANGRLLGIVGAVAVAAGLGGVIWRSTERTKGQRAERAFFEAQGAAQGGPAALERAMRPLTTRYSGTAGGAQAALLLVQSLYDQGKFQDGLNVLARTKVPDEFEDGTEFLKAVGLEGAGRPLEAAKVYEQLAAAPGIAPRRRDDLRAGAARAYELGGDRAAAARSWQQIVTDGSGPRVDEARIRVGELSAR